MKHLKATAARWQRKKRVKTTQTKINPRKQNRTRKHENPKRKKKALCKKGRPSQYPGHEHQDRLTKQGLKRKKNSARATMQRGGVSCGRSSQEQQRLIVQHPRRGFGGGGGGGYVEATNNKLLSSSSSSFVVRRRRPSSSVVVIDTLSGRSEFLFTIFLFAGRSFFCWESRGGAPPSSLVPALRRALVRLALLLLRLRLALLRRVRVGVRVRRPCYHFHVRTPSLNPLFLPGFPLPLHLSHIPCGGTAYPAGAAGAYPRPYGWWYMLGGMPYGCCEP